MARERDLASGREDPVAIVGRGVRRREDERGLRGIHLQRDPADLDGREARRPREHRERIAGERRVREDVDPPEIEEPLRHARDLGPRGWGCALLILARQVFARADLPRRGTSIPTPNSAVRQDIAIRDRRVADRVQKFPESVIREMTRIAVLHGAVDLAQGYPDFEPPPELTAAAKRGLDRGDNQYSITSGARAVREAIARRAQGLDTGAVGAGGEP